MRQHLNPKHWRSKGGGGGTRGPCTPSPINRRVKKLRDWSKSIHISFPTPTLQLHLMCKKKNVIFKNLPTCSPFRALPPFPLVQIPGYATDLKSFHAGRLSWPWAPAIRDFAPPIYFKILDPPLLIYSSSCHTVLCFWVVIETPPWPQNKSLTFTCFLWDLVDVMDGQSRNCHQIRS